MGWVKAEKTIWGPKLKKHGWPKAEKTSGDHILNHHMVAAAEGGRHHVVKGGRRPPVNMWSPLVFSAFGPAMFFQLLAPYCFFSFCPAHVFSAFAQIALVFLGKLGPKFHVLSASLYTTNHAACSKSRSDHFMQKGPAAKQIRVKVQVKVKDKPSRQEARQLLNSIHMLAHSQRQ